MKYDIGIEQLCTLTMSLIRTGSRSQYFIFGNSAADSILKLQLGVNEGAPCLSIEFLINDPNKDTLILWSNFKAKFESFIKSEGLKQKKYYTEVSLKTAETLEFQSVLKSLYEALKLDKIDTKMARRVFLYPNYGAFVVKTSLSLGTLALYFGFLIYEISYLDWSVDMALVKISGTEITLALLLLALRFFSPSIIRFTVNPMALKAAKKDYEMSMPKKVYRLLIRIAPIFMTVFTKI